LSVISTPLPLDLDACYLQVKEESKRRNLLCGLVLGRRKERLDDQRGSRVFYSVDTAST
jgi:hypothetical protein